MRAQCARRQTEFFERLDDDRGRRDGKNGAKEDAVQLAPAEQHCDLVSDPDHQQDLERRGDGSDDTDFAQFAKAELEAEPEHQEDNAELR